MTDITSNDWTPQDEANISASPNGSQGGFKPSTIAPIIRTIRGAVKRAHNKINAILVTTGTATALVITHTVAPAALVKGERYSFFSSQTNTGAITLNVNGLGAKAILQQDGTALKAGQIVSGSAVAVTYDGTAFRLENYVSNPKFSGTLTADALTVPTINGTTITGTTVNGTHTGNGAALTALNASNLASGTLPNARISGAYDGITTLAQTGMHTITTGGEAIRITSANDTSDPFIGIHKTIDSVVTRQGYIQHLDGTTVGTTGFAIHNDLSNMRIVLDNTASTDGLTFRVGTANYNVWNTGNLPTPAVQATQIIAGNGLSGGGTIAANRTVTLGTPGTITNTTTNAVTTTSHTHALTLVSADITGALGYVPSKGDGLPIGSMIMIYGNDSSAPPGFLLANGAAVTATYPELRAFGLARGWSVTSGNPRLPDMGGYFPRGWRSGQTVDSGRTFGSVQQDALQNITGSLNSMGSNSAPMRADSDASGALAIVDTGLATGNGVSLGNGVGNRRVLGFDASLVARTAEETRPSNVTVTFWIKAYDVDNTSGAINLSNVANDVNALQARATTIESRLMGVGQTWQDMTSSRVAGTVYQNTTGRPISVTFSYFSTGATIATMRIGSTSTPNIVVSNLYTVNGAQGNVSIPVVPPNAYYSVTISSGTPTSITWAELR